MFSGNQKYIGWKIGGLLIVLFFVLLLFPRTKAESKDITTVNSLNISEFEEQFFHSLPDSVLNQRNELKKSPSFDEIKFWKEKGFPAGIAIVSYRYAEQHPSDSSWTEAGMCFVKNAFSVPDKDRKESFILALQCFDKALRLNSGYRPALMNKGSVLVESGMNPMEGIGMLKKLEFRDSTDAELLIRLGRYSMQSRQTDKAMERFHRALKADSSRLDALLYLADIYKEKGEITLSLKYLKMFAYKTSNPEEKKAALDFIRELENTMSNN